jgi:hypothetical protein
MTSLLCPKQDDIQLRRNGQSFELVGVVNMGEIYNDIQLLQTGVVPQFFTRTSLYKTYIEESEYISHILYFILLIFLV